jgi:hypothetical protein
MKTITAIILLAFLLMATISHAQFSYQKLVDHNKIDKAFAKTKKRMQANNKDVSALYDLSTLYVFSNKKKKGLKPKKEKDNAERAYLYALKASKAYAQTTDKDLKKLNKKGINNKALKKLNNKACYSILKIAKRKNTIEDYKKAY